ncbi:MAG: hypothetical protein FWG77_10820 [Treponema sp.]|nr:hypothetical protein [Treponema sp.]
MSDQISEISGSIMKQITLFSLSILLFVVFGCSTAPVPTPTDTAPDRVFTVGQTEFSISSSEVIITAAERLRRNLRWWPDSIIGAVNKGDGTYTFYISDGPISNMSVGTLDNLGQRNNRNFRILSPRTRNLDYMSGGPVYRLDEDTLLLFYRGETYHAGNWREFNSMLGVAVSTTKNRRGDFVNFRDLGLILTTHVSFDEVRTVTLLPVEMMSPAFAVYDGYMYMYFCDFNSPHDYMTRFISVARASIADIATAVKNNTAPVFHKYYNGSFTENGLGGRSTPLGNNLNNGMIDVSYNTYINQFIMLSVQYDSNTTTNMYLSTSVDGITWSRRVRISDERPDLFHTSIIGLGDDPRLTGKEFYIYYNHSLTPRSPTSNRLHDATLLRRRITIN